MRGSNKTKCLYIRYFLVEPPPQTVFRKKFSKDWTQGTGKILCYIFFYSRFKFSIQLYSYQRNLIYNFSVYKKSENTNKLNSEDTAQTNKQVKNIKVLTFCNVTDTR